MAKTETRKSQLPQSSKADQESVFLASSQTVPGPLSSFDTHARLDDDPTEKWGTVNSLV